MQDFIERLRAKPEHVRKQIAVGTAGTITGVVALGWITALVAGGTLAIDAPQASPETAVLAEKTQTGFQNLMGAASAFTGATTTAPDLKVIDSNTSSTLDRNQQETETRTVIPF